MGLRTFGSSIRLDSLKGELIALRYTGEREVTSTPSWNNGKELTQQVARANVIEFVPEGTGKKKSLRAVNHGETLVYQKAIANDIRGSSEWAYGVLVQNARPTETAPDATMFELELPTDFSADDIVTAMEAANIKV